MSQRLSKSKNRKNRTDHITMATAGSTVRQSTKSLRTEVSAPPLRTKAVVPSAPQEKPVERAGLAKASPSFKEVTPVELPSKDNQEKALAENQVEDKKTEE